MFHAELETVADVYAEAGGRAGEGGDKADFDAFAGMGCRKAGSEQAGEQSFFM